MRWSAGSGGVPGCGFGVNESGLLPLGEEGPCLRVGEPARSMYVHAPFCARRCLYCDFAVTVSRRGETETWLGALEAEMGHLEGDERFPLADELETLFVGGGTPSILGPGAMDGLAGVVGVDRLPEGGVEWTSEANPESFTREVAEAWARAGVNRVSLGAQSFQAEALRWMGRLHGPEGPEEAVRRARRAGIRNLSVDLIFGLPGEVRRDWVMDLSAALALEVPHLSLYGLTVEEATPLGRAVASGEATPVEEDRYRDEFLSASECLTGAGYRQYELSNFALPGFEARHNQAYWKLRPYLGIGNSAHSFCFPFRRWNLRDWGEYQNAVRKGGSPVLGEEKLEPEHVRLESVWLGLRTDEGIPRSGLSARAVGLAEDWARQGLAELGTRTLRLTPEGWLFLDRLAVELDSALAADASVP